MVCVCTICGRSGHRALEFCALSGPSSKPVTCSHCRRLQWWMGPAHIRYQPSLGSYSMYSSKQSQCIAPRWCKGKAYPSWPVTVSGTSMLPSGAVVPADGCVWSKDVAAVHGTERQIALRSSSYRVLETTTCLQYHIHSSNPIGTTSGWTMRVRGKARCSFHRGARRNVPAGSCRYRASTLGLLNRVRCHCLATCAAAYFPECQTPAVCILAVVRTAAAASNGACISCSCHWPATCCSRYADHAVLDDELESFQGP
jgi:hypothetical protein